MPYSTTKTTTLISPGTFGLLLLGAALALAPTLGYAQEPAASATAVVKSADGQDHGTVTVSETPSGAVHLVMDLKNLSEGARAVHIHETGKCEGPTFETAGGHLAGGKNHGALDAGGMHQGDLPNLVPEGGNASQELFLQGVTLADIMDADGAAFIMHAGVDDYASQPSGNAGDRIACGVFEAVQATN